MDLPLSFENDVIEKVELNIEKIKEDLITAQKKGTL